MSTKTFYNTNEVKIPLDFNFIINTVPLLSVLYLDEWNVTMYREFVNFFLSLLNFTCTFIVVFIVMIPIGFIILAPFYFGNEITKDEFSYNTINNAIKYFNYTELTNVQRHALTFSQRLRIKFLVSLYIYNEWYSKYEFPVPKICQMIETRYILGQIQPKYFWLVCKFWITAIYFFIYAIKADCLPIIEDKIRLCRNYVTVEWVIVFMRIGLVIGIIGLVFTLIYFAFIFMLSPSWPLPNIDPSIFGDRFCPYYLPITDFKATVPSPLTLLQAELYENMYIYAFIAIIALLFALIAVAIIVRTKQK